MADANSLLQQCFTNTQEQELIWRINYLSEKQVLPTGGIAMNLVTDLSGTPVWKKMGRIICASAPIGS
jgi:hypothetical protein